MAACQHRSLCYPDFNVPNKDEENKRQESQKDVCPGCCESDRLSPIHFYLHCCAALTALCFPKRFTNYSSAGQTLIFDHSINRSGTSTCK